MPVFNMLEFLKIKKGLKGIFNICGEEEGCGQGCGWQWKEENL